MISSAMCLPLKMHLNIYRQYSVMFIDICCIEIQMNVSLVIVYKMITANIVFLVYQILMALDTVNSTRVLCERSFFGLMPDGRSAERFSLSNCNGLKISFTNFGCTLLNVILPNIGGSQETPVDVVLAYDCLDKMRLGEPNFGSIVGRYNVVL